MLLLFLFFTGLLAGTVDAIAGGGGLISMPVLLSIGIPPHVALGTNKLQSSIGTFMAARKYYRQGLMPLQSIWLGILFVVFGASLGAIVSQLISSDSLRKIVPMMLALILVYTILSPKFGADDKHPRLNLRHFSMLFGFVFGFYDGFLGPGVGSFWVFSITFFLGFNLIKATAYTKAFNLTSNVVALICFMVGSNVDYRIGLCMAMGQIIGGWLGAHLAIKRGAQFVRPVFLIMVTGTIASLLYKNYATSPVVIHFVKQYEWPMMLMLCLLLVSVLSFYFRRLKSEI